jgi:ceramide glucosyltransferase
MWGIAFAIVFIALGALQLLTAVLTVRYVARSKRRAGEGAASPREPVSVVSAIALLGRTEADSALSALTLASPETEVLYCAFDDTNWVEARVRDEIAARPGVNARLLLGRSQVSVNPKMDNIEKGYRAATADLVVFIDGNLAVPDDLVDLLLAAAEPGIGAVSAVPLAVAPGNFWAELECAFLNNFQARWQIASAELGSAFAQGKLFMTRKTWLEGQGGIEALRGDLAEDTALTKLVRAAGLKVALVARPLELPLGRRRFADVLNRQMRWSFLRRRALPLLNFTEVLSSFPALVASGAVAMILLGLPPWPLVLVTVVLWYSLDAALALACGWHWRLAMLPAALVRDCLSLPVWLSGWIRSGYVWRDQSIRIGPR